jgi:porin
MTLRLCRLFVLTLLACGFARAAVAESVHVGAALTTDFAVNTRGGLRTGGIAMHNLDLMADWRPTAGWEAYGYVLVDAHGGFSALYAGDAQTVSNIDAVPGTRLFEAWLRRTSEDGRHITSFGLINLNGLFDVQPVGSLFLNASPGIGPDYSQSHPSIFPVSALGLVHEWRPGGGWQARFGLFDGEVGDPHNPAVFTSLSLSARQGYHAVAEVERDFDQGFVKVGLWGYNRGAARLNGAGMGPRQGGYIQIGRTLTQEAAHPDQGLAGWLRLGTAEGAVFPVRDYAGGGLVYTGLLAGRDQDRAGLAIYSARYGTDWRGVTPGARAAETTLEASYQYLPRAGVLIQPDLQYIRHPGAVSGVGDALAVILRVKLSTPD